MSAKHTPGPWIVNRVEDESSEDGYRYDVDAESGIYVAEIVGGMHGDCGDELANARLIAAAPDGLEAAQAAYAALIARPMDGWRISNQRIYAMLRDFIAKAMGRDSEDVQREFEERSP